MVDTEERGAKKLSQRQVDEMLDGLPPEAQAVLLKSLANKDLLPGKGPSSGVSREEKVRIFKDLVGEAGTEEMVINITDLVDAGMPDSIAATPYWAGTADGAAIAWEHGWKSSLRAARNEVKGKPGKSYTLNLHLRPLTEKDKEKRRKKEEKKAGTVKPMRDDAIPPEPEGEE